MSSVEIEIESENRSIAIGGRDIGVFKDAASAWSHFVAMWIAIIAGIALMVDTWGDTPKFLSTTFYSFTLIAVFMASSLYHFFDMGHEGNRWLRRMDHAAIFLLIAGTSIPFVVHLMDGSARSVMLILIVAVMTTGIVFKIAWIDCPDWLGAGIYIGFGLLVAIGARSIFIDMPTLIEQLLAVGGVVFMMGAVVFVTQRPDPYPGVLGHHEIWHFFVIGGAALHYTAVWLLRDVAIPAF